jgi:uncharacterized membrane protein YvlD (DUF360 family)
MTHGLFQIVINWALLGLAVWITPNVKGGWLPTLIGSIVITIIGTLLAEAWKPESTTTAA